MHLAYYLGLHNAFNYTSLMKKQVKKQVTVVPNIIRSQK